jgi:hypothetical protein
MRVGPKRIADEFHIKGKEARQLSNCQQTAIAVVYFLFLCVKNNVCVRVLKEYGIAILCYNVKQTCIIVVFMNSGKE